MDDHPGAIYKGRPAYSDEGSGLDGLSIARNIISLITSEHTKVVYAFVQGREGILFSFDHGALYIILAFLVPSSYKTVSYKKSV